MTPWRPSPRALLTHGISREAMEAAYVDSLSPEPVKVAFARDRVSGDVFEVTRRGRAFVLRDDDGNEREVNRAELATNFERLR